MCIPVDVVPTCTACGCVCVHCLNTLQYLVRASRVLSLEVLGESLVTIFLIAGETFVTRKVTRSVAQIHLGHMNSVSRLPFSSYGYSWMQVCGCVWVGGGGGLGMRLFGTETVRVSGLGLGLSEGLGMGVSWD